MSCTISTLLIYTTFRKYIAQIIVHQKSINQADLWKEDKLFKFYVPLTNEHLMLIYFLSVYERIRNQKRLFLIHSNVYNVLVEWIQDGHLNAQNIWHFYFAIIILFRARKTNMFSMIIHV